MQDHAGCYPTHYQNIKRNGFVKRGRGAEGGVTIPPVCPPGTGMSAQPAERDASHGEPCCRRFRTAGTTYETGSRWIEQRTWLDPCCIRSGERTQGGSVARRGSRFPLLRPLFLGRTIRPPRGNQPHSASGRPYHPAFRESGEIDFEVIRERVGLGSVNQVGARRGGHETLR